jgi:hypothetical protein
MLGFDLLDTLFVAGAFLIQIVLIIHFALRRWRFDFAIRNGWIVYALGIPLAGVSVLELLGGRSWSLWLGGFLYLAWAIFGYVAEYVRKIEWRAPIRGAIFGPYLLLYLGMLMFYWFPLALIAKPLWYAYAVLFVVSTFLNVSSHKGSTPQREGTIR